MVEDGRKYAVLLPTGKLSERIYFSQVFAWKVYMMKNKGVTYKELMR